MIQHGKVAAKVVETLVYNEKLRHLSGDDRLNQHCVMDLVMDLCLYEKKKSCTLGLRKNVRVLKGHCPEECYRDTPAISYCISIKLGDS